MNPPPLALNEPQRIQALHDLNLLDTPAEERFDRITRIAARLLNVPIAYISLVDSDRQFLKSCFGIPLGETSRDIAFCAHAILENEALVVPDALLDERFVDNPLVTGEPFIRFYIGRPLTTPDGSRVGTLCVADRQPRLVTDEDLSLIKDLALLAERELIHTELEKSFEQQQKIQRQLERIAEMAAEASNAKSEFLANMSHEVRTPINAIVGMTGLILNTEMTSEQCDYIDTIRQSSNALLTIINDILDFSKIEAGKLELEHATFNIQNVVEEACDYVSAQTTEKNLELINLIDPSLPGEVLGDVTRVRQVLANLLSNAVKFTLQGEIMVEIVRQPSHGHQSDNKFWVQFSVHDTGIGIPSDKINGLFDTFSQVDASTTRKFGGTGLGLAISKKLVNLMDGEITVDSQPGRGATFTFALPLEVAPIESPPEKPATVLEGKRLLIVDDNENMRAMLAERARSWGMEWLAAETAGQAMSLVRQGENFDVALIDMDLRENDGRELSAHIRQERGSRAIPLVLLASLKNHAELAKNLPAGFVACLAKPIHSDQLQDVLAQAVMGHKVSRKLQRRSGRLDPLFGKKNPLRILVAEDNTVNQKVIVNILSQLGYRPDLAQNGLEVLQAIDRQPYDVILMDVQMPEMDGLAASREVRRRRGENKKPYIIAMTANAMDGDSTICLQAGMDAYLSKPIRLEQLQAALVTGSGAIKESVDPEALERLRALAGEGEPDPLTELIDLFLADSPQVLSDMTVALQRKDASAIGKCGHKLRGSCDNFGSRTMSTICSHIENSAKQSDLAAVRALLETLRLEYAQVEKILRQSRKMPSIKI
jgi:signal transduction histidine kinase/DNA-binding response OmpR family regulator/HPt (histidine-containing phosphotransfer) domain-containing protein